MSSNTVKDNRTPATSNTEYNAIQSMIRNTLGREVETASLVSIDGADQNGSTGPGGYADATPLVKQIDAYGNGVDQVSVPKLPFWRHQAGKCAIILDPQPGDKGVLIALKRDSSNIQSGKGEQVLPGSYRVFDASGGVVMHGFLGETPEVWLWLDPPTGNISLSTKAANIDISCRESGDIVVKTGSGNIAIQAGNGGEGTITLDGRVVVTRNIIVQNKNGEGQSQMQGGISNTGGAITSNTVTLETHNHNGVQPGGGNTGSPNGGT